MPVTGNTKQQLAKGSRKMKSIKKILIANRGEIAVRIIRAAREMNLIPVVVYSDADATSLAVRLADEAYYIGPSPASQSYLNMDKIIEAAKAAHVDAIHPGYGFLAENAEFATRVEENDLIFIGPTPELIATMGCKTLARNIMQEAGIPVVPGILEPIENKEDLFRTADRIGFPLLLKASAGGGGKGMRRVNCAAELGSAFDRARSEAMSSFGNSAIYIEKVIENPHHIEIQILADYYGNIICLGERECSMQRRYQKILEEAPSPFIDRKTRKNLEKFAVRAAKAINYKNAGSIEFIVDADRNCYFLEMNTRLQVEHTVTEMVTGIDLVKEQIRIARGEPLDFTQDDIQPKGAAIQCRIYAEDPDNNFAPSPGEILEYFSPGGSGVRDDTGVCTGSQVPIFYDPLISKLVAWGQNRSEVIKRTKRALSEYRIDGIKTNIPYFLWILDKEEFMTGNYTTSIIERNKPDFWMHARRSQSIVQTTIAQTVAVMPGDDSNAHKHNMISI
jgi:acetyl-CoA carboxylase biotin carboxylase subunit